LKITMAALPWLPQLAPAMARAARVCAAAEAEEAAARAKAAEGAMRISCLKGYGGTLVLVKLYFARALSLRAFRLRSR